MRVVFRSRVDRDGNFQVPKRFRTHHVPNFPESVRGNSQLGKMVNSQDFDRTLTEVLERQGVPVGKLCNVDNVGWAASCVRDRTGVYVTVGVAP